jgi:energy-coupling factor transport system substrate-specific component
MRKFSIKEAAAAFIGTVLFVMLTEVQIPFSVVSNTAFEIRAGMIAAFAAIFGPVVAGLIGLVGHAVGDAIFYGSISWSWVIADAVFGVVVGMFICWFGIRERSFGAKEMLLFNLVQVFANILAWIVVAPVLDILLYAEPARKVFEQGAFACISNILTVAVLGTLFTFAYSKSAVRPSDVGFSD